MALLDAVSLGLNGKKCCEALRAMRQLSELPVVVLTPRPTADDLGALLAAGASDFAPSPPDKSELAARMDMLPNSTHNLLKTLVACEYAAQTPDGRYVAGPVCHHIGMRTASVCGHCWTPLTSPA